MALDDQTSRPLYRQVADELRGQIQRQELTPGGQLPTEAKLMSQYGVSRNTIRLALGVLRSEGLVVTGQGRGSFVADVEASVVPRNARAQRHVVDHQTFDSHVIEFDEPGDADHIDVTVAVRLAPPVIADALRLPSGARVVERRRLLYRGGQPSQTADSYVPEGLATDADLRRQSALAGGLAVVFERSGRPITAHVDEITVRMPSPAEAQQLQIATGVPVVALLRTSYDGSEAPVVATVLVMPGDRNMLRYNVRIDTASAEASEADGGDT